MDHTTYHGRLATVMQDIKLTTEKHAPASRAISVTMRIKRHDAERIAQYGRSRLPRCHWLPPSGNYSPRIAPVDSMVIDFGKKKSSCGVVKSLSEARVQKAQNRPSTQLIEGASCIDRPNAMMKAEELS